MTKEQIKAEKRKQETIGTIAYTKMLLKQIDELQKENKKINKAFKVLHKKFYKIGIKEYCEKDKRLEQAKEVIKEFIAWFTDQTESDNWKSIVEKAEQFIKEIER